MVQNICVPGRAIKRTGKMSSRGETGRQGNRTQYKGNPHAEKKKKQGQGGQTVAHKKVAGTQGAPEKKLRNQTSSSSAAKPSGGSAMLLLRLCQAGL